MLLGDLQVGNDTTDLAVLQGCWVDVLGVEGALPHIQHVHTLHCTNISTHSNPTTLLLAMVIIYSTYSNYWQAAV